MSRIFFALFGAWLVAQQLSAQDGEIPSPETVVKRLYTEHIANKGVLVEKEERKFWEFQFGEKLNEVLKAKNWGFDPLFFAQDAEIKDLKVKEIDRDDKARVLVLVTFTNFGERTALIVACHETDHGYKVDNITQPSTGIDLINNLADKDE